MAGIKFYQVGGSVRDELLGLKPKDYDFAVEAPSLDAMRDAIKARGNRIFVEAPHFFTIRAEGQVRVSPELTEKIVCDYVLCRKDGAYKDFRHPEKVEIGTLLDDLARRDFTVNAIAKDEDGGYIDPHGGILDIKGRVLRCVGTAQDRFTEDGLRMLRALRFYITRGFVFDSNITACVSRRDFFESRLQGVSIERVREELRKMFECDTKRTLELFDLHRQMRQYLFGLERLWLMPTLKEK